MKDWKNQRIIMLLSMITLTIFLTSCSSSIEEPTGSLTVVNELKEEVTLTNKERATILFHFTGAG